jgi:pentatricopeptide repeat protein
MGNVVLWAVLSALSEVLFAPFCSVCETRRHEAFILLVGFLACFLVSGSAKAKGRRTSLNSVTTTRTVMDRVALDGGHRASPVSPTWERASPEKLHVRCDKEPEGQVGHHTTQPTSDVRAIDHARTEGLAAEALKVSGMVQAMQACTRLGHVEAALELFDHMLENGAAPDAHLLGKVACDKFFNIIANNLDVKRMRKDGLRLFDLVQAHGLAPSTRMQSRLIIAWKSKLPKPVLRYILKMKSTGCVISRLVYFAIVLASEQSDPELTVKTFEEMEALGIKPDRVAFNAVLGACSKLGWHDEARQLFMQMADRKLVPDEKSYAIMIHVYRSSNQFKDAVALFETMREHCLKPRRHDYHNAITSCVNLQRIEYAVELYNDMVQAEVRPCESTCAYLRAGCQALGWSPSEI